MVVVDKVEWMRHDGNANLYSIDVDPTGKRVATSGGAVVKIWNLLPVLDPKAEADPNTPKLLATLTDHISSVNVVRFSRRGRFLASGADDKTISIYELRPGRGMAGFGTKDAASVENWKIVQQLRGHGSNVTDLAWSMDDKYVASCSVDNYIIVWEAETGARVKQLAGHEGMVKGVAWDPMGSYLATQGDDSIIIWRCDTWAQVARITEPLQRAAANNFHARLGWAPHGQFLATAASFDHPSHVSVLLKRGEGWASDFSFVGHSNTVTAVRFNPRLYYSRTDAESDAAQFCAALASQDKRFTVWVCGEDRPLLVGDKFFAAGAMDLAWTPDGASLLVCSYDGTVAACHFEPGELGRPVPESEVDTLLSELYGDPKLRQRALAESADVFALDALAAVGGPSPMRAAPAAAAAANAMPPPARPLGVAPAAAAAAAPKAALLDKLSSRMGNGAAGEAGPRRMQPVPVGGGGGGAGPSGVPGPLSPTHARAGPKPVAVGPPSEAGHPPAAKRLALTPVDATAGAAARPGAAGATAAAAPTQQQQQQVVGPAAVAAGAVLLAAPPVRTMLSVELGRARDPLAPPGEGDYTVVLEALNARVDARGRPVAELVCSASGRAMWRDHLPGQVVEACGSLHYAAVSTSAGDLQLYSPAGRRLLPPIQLGAPAAFLAADASGWRLLAVATDGALRLWDVRSLTCTLEASCAAILRSAGVELVSVRVSAAGLPIAVLSNRHAYTYHTGMKAWVRLADDSAPTSGYHTSLLTPSTAGELSRLQYEANQAGRSPADVLLPLLSQGPAAQEAQSRAHLEANVAAALVLRSPAEWRRWFIMYVRRLAADADEPRLREVIDDLMGPLRWSPDTHGAVAAAAVPSGADGSSYAARGGCGGGGGDEEDQEAAAARCWEPTILGLDKRRLLRAEVLKEIARNRANQRLVAEAMENLKEIDAMLAAAATTARNGRGGDDNAMLDG